MERCLLSSFVGPSAFLSGDKFFEKCKHGMVCDHLVLLKIKSMVDTFYVEVAVKGLNVCNDLLHCNSITTTITSYFKF